MRGLRMHDRYGVNLLAVAREGMAPRASLGSIRFRTGDVLLLQGERNTLQQALSTMMCLPLADRGLRVPRQRPIHVPLAVFGAAIAATALGLVPVQIAFVTVVATLVLFGTLSLREVYESVEWPVILLLGALIPIGERFDYVTGGVRLSAEGPKLRWLVSAYAGVDAYTNEGIWGVVGDLAYRPGPNFELRFGGEAGSAFGRSTTEIGATLRFAAVWRW